MDNEFYKKCIAKTFKQGEESKLGRTVFDHCKIVGEVAKVIVSGMPDSLKEAFFPKGVELVAAAHDVGKICPTFQKKIHDAAKTSCDHLPQATAARPENEENWGFHQGVSMLAAEGCSLGQKIAKILGMHHGLEPNTRTTSFNDESLGGSLWQKNRENFLNDLKDEMGCDWPSITKDQVDIIAGLTTVSDWVGSSPAFDDPNQTPEIPNVLKDIGFNQLSLKEHVSFSEIFGFEPRPAQEALINMSQKQGVYILEAPMGYGKTEAALYVAYRLLVEKQARGIYFALPTQLTSNSMHERMESFLKKITKTEQNSRLLHSNAWVFEQELGSDAAAGKSWFDPGKRGLVAPFAVGTVDQALLSVLNVSHYFVRAFGLAGKVVIIDEAHSYDVYTGTLLDKLIKDLRKWHCTVIVLSATLTTNRRNELIEGKSQSQSYPLVTAAFKKDEPIKEVEIPFSDSFDVNIYATRDELKSLEEALIRAEQGQRVLWIENSVDEAQQVFKQLLARGGERGVECGLLHSRFLKKHRKEIEDHWVKKFGKGVNTERGQKGCILVGTQILEQSLDIDADFMVSRICPTDMLLQRIGRLWRHSSTNRPKEAKREIWILTPESFEDFGVTGKIYAPYVLCRTLEIWNHLNKISLPIQIRDLLEETYKEREENTKYLIETKKQMDNKKYKVRYCAENSLAKRGLPKRDSIEAFNSTRYIDIENVEVLLLKGHHKQDNGEELVLLDEQRIYLPKISSNRFKSKLAAHLKKNTLMVQGYYAPKEVKKDHLEWLSHYLYLGEGESSLRVGIVKQSGAIVNLNGDSIGAFYDKTFGYCLEKGGKENGRK